MSTRERPKKEKEEEKTSPSMDDWLDDMSADKVKKTEPLENVIGKTEKVVEIDSTIKLREQFNSGVPPWVKKPWMYVKPTHPNHLTSWKESWKTLILEYSKTFNLHIINLTELGDEYPFENSAINKQLTKPQLDTIVQEMVENGLAKWLDENNILVRIYYKTLDQWKEIILSFLFDGGYVAEILNMYDIQNMGQEWSNLPRNDLVDIFQDLVDNNRARWIGKEKDTIKFEI